MVPDPMVWKPSDDPDHGTFFMRTKVGWQALVPKGPVYSNPPTGSYQPEGWSALPDPVQPQLMRYLEPVELPAATSFERTLGKDGLMHYDCPSGDMGPGPCRCGAYALHLGGEHADG